MLLSFSGQSITLAALVLFAGVCLVCANCENAFGQAPAAPAPAGAAAPAGVPGPQGRGAVPNSAAAGKGKAAGTAKKGKGGATAPPVSLSDTAKAAAAKTSGPSSVAIDGKTSLALPAGDAQKSVISGRGPLGQTQGQAPGASAHCPPNALNCAMTMGEPALDAMMSANAQIAQPAPPAAPVNPLMSILQTCGQLLPGLMGTVGNLFGMASDENEKEGFKPYPGMSGANAAAVGSGLNNTLGGSCQKFIDKEGNVGPWGRTMLEEMNNDKNKNCYTNHNPPDMNSLCPNFDNGMDAERRQLFWLWLFASMAEPESSCNPSNTSPGPNGTNIGLFQLDVNGCRVAGVHVTEDSLLDAGTNSRCAVNRLCYEMKNRGKVEAEHSRNKYGTYWAVLRGKSVHWSESNAPVKFEALVRSYPDCRLGSPGPAALRDREPVEQQTGQVAEEPRTPANDSRPTEAVSPQPEGETEPESGRPAMVIPQGPAIPIDGDGPADGEPPAVLPRPAP